MHKHLLLLPAVILLAFGPASVTTSLAQSAKANAEAMTRAKKIYEVDCALCHGSKGDGKTDLAKDMSLTLSDFTDPKTLSTKSDQQIFDLIRKGKDKMPGEEEGRAKNDDVKSLIIYIRNMSKDQPAAPAEPAPAAASTAAPAPSSR